MARRTLIIHHLESMWNNSFKKIAGKDFETISLELASALRRRKFDLVILTRFEDSRPEDGHFETGLAALVNVWEEYGYGWDLEESGQLELVGEEFAEGGSHSRHVLTPEWIKNLKGNKVTLCGAFDGECIEDMEIALKACQVKFDRWEKFIF